MNSYIQKRIKGFTLIEVLLVIAIIAILAGVVIVAINPAKQLADANNTQRSNDVKALYDALQQYAIDNDDYPAGIRSLNKSEDAWYWICDTGSMTSAEVGENYCEDLVNLSVLVPKYISKIPVDPLVEREAVFLLREVSAQSDFVPKNSAGYQVKLRATATSKAAVSAPLTQNVSVGDKMIARGEERIIDENILAMVPAGQSVGY